MAGFFGIRRVRSVRGEERRPCPRCRVSRSFTLTDVRLNLITAGRPFLPLSAAHTFAECAHCGRTFENQQFVRARTSEEAIVLSADDRAIHALVAAAIMADSRVRPREKQVARDVIKRHTGRELSTGELERELQRIRREIPDPVRFLRDLAPVLSEGAKTRILEAAYEMASADQELHPAETRLIVAAGEALQVSPMTVREAMRTVRQRKRERRGES